MVAPRHHAYALREHAGTRAFSLLKKRRKSSRNCGRALVSTFLVYRRAPQMRLSPGQLLRQVNLAAPFHMREAEQS